MTKYPVYPEVSALLGCLCGAFRLFSVFRLRDLVSAEDQGDSGG